MVEFKQWTVLHLSGFITFIFSGLAINAAQAGIYLIIGWWNKSLFRKINYYLVWMIYAQVSSFKVHLKVHYFYNPKSHEKLQICIKTSQYHS
jgi:hypothetical protein